MDGRERVVRTLRFEGPDRTPRDLWTLPAIGMFRQDELDAMLERFPSDIAGPQVQYGRGERERGTPYVVGSYVDAWGCVWHVAEAGVVGEVKGPPLADWSALDRFKPPYEILDTADFGSASRERAGPDGSAFGSFREGVGFPTFRGQRGSFVLAGTTIRPFERMQFLRGSEALFLDLGYQPAELCRLRDMVHEFYMRELELWVKTDVDGISFMDDWGSQKSLLISHSQWQSTFKPLYKDYCDLIHSAGKFAFFHSDGQIADIYPDLIEIGVDAVNSQLFCMDVEALGRQFKGQIAFWGEIDRQHILPFGTPEEVRAAVRRVRAALDNGCGGVFAQCEWGIGVSAENVAAVFDAWLE
ncbi:MAG: methyltransferase [Anaerolineae bacterium]|nr:methyltransferase [Anaerolineae bacterium]